MILLYPIFLLNELCRKEKTQRNGFLKGNLDVDAISFYIIKSFVATVLSVFHFVFNSKKSTILYTLEI